ncbi:hypothetical protein DIPPA_17724 [Diplonema papillatum]|nr:hypothetical protein DIPPA_17724 [Diplonema papillatum]
MVEQLDIVAAVRQEILLVEAQLKHSREQRKRRRAEKEEKERSEAESKLAEEREKQQQQQQQQVEQEKQRLPVRESNDRRRASLAESETPSQTSESPSSLTGQVAVKKVGKVTLQSVVPAPGAQPTASSDSAAASPVEPAAPEQVLNPVEIKRQRDLEQKRRKTQQQQEEEARQQAQKADPATEKGGPLEYFVQGKFKMWSKQKSFCVVRKAGIYFYKTPPQGRGNTKGGVKYDMDVKPDHMVPFLVEEVNSRGSKATKSSLGSRLVTKTMHPKAEKQDRQFGIHYYEKGEWRWLLVECVSSEEREEWTAFTAKFIKFS